MRRLTDLMSCAAAASRAHTVATEANLTDVVVVLAGTTPQPALR